MSEVEKLDLIWGVKAISEEIGRSQRATYHAISKGELPVKLVAGRYVAERSKLYAYFLGDAA